MDTIIICHDSAFKLKHLTPWYTKQFFLQLATQQTLRCKLLRVTWPLERWPLERDCSFVPAFGVLENSVITWGVKWIWVTPTKPLALRDGGINHPSDVFDPGAPFLSPGNLTDLEPYLKTGFARFSEKFPALFQDSDWFFQDSQIDINPFTSKISILIRPYCLPYIFNFLLEFNRFPELARTRDTFPGNPILNVSRIPGLSRTHMNPVKI